MSEHDTAKYEDSEANLRLISKLETQWFFTLLILESQRRAEQRRHSTRKPTPEK